MLASLLQSCVRGICFSSTEEQSSTRREKEREIRRPGNGTHAKFGQPDQRRSNWRFHTDEERRVREERAGRKAGWNRTKLKGSGCDPDSERIFEIGNDWGELSKESSPLSLWYV